MLRSDRAGAEKLLLQLEAGGWMDPRYQFCKSDHALRLLGSGGFSYVYEMYDVQAPDRRYAAKVIGLGAKQADEEAVAEAVRIQHSLSEQSENIVKVIALWRMKVHLDDCGNVRGITRFDEKEYAAADGIPLQIVLMERLDPVLRKDKYGNVSLLRDDLTTEEGVISFAEQIGGALSAVHSNGYLHRDVKLENIFWDNRLRQYKLGDFGTARYVGDGDAETVVFTDGYGAPEIERQLADSYRAAADMYSFGITLFLLLNECRFPASDGYYANMVQYSKDFVLPAPVHASENMARIIRKMCSYRAEDRYQSAEQVRTDMGRMDGSDADPGAAEYEDLPTETYREEHASAAKTGGEPEKGDAEDREPDREERKRRAQLREKRYRKASICSMGLSAALFALLFWSFSPNASYVSAWQFWIVPAAVLISAILQRIKEFHIAFGAVTIGLAVCSMCALGADVPQIAMILAVILGVPAITAGCAIGSGLWIAQMLSGKPAWLALLLRWNPGWLVLIGLVAAAESSMLLRAAFQKETLRRFLVWTWILNRIWYLMVIVGLVLWALGRFHVIVIPETVKQIHLVRVGMGLFLVRAGYWEDDDVPADEAESDDGEEGADTDESVDE